MKILFLDVDGVLAHAGTQGKGRGESVDSSFYYLAQVDPACMLRLKRVLDATGAKVVVSSTWRRWDAPMTGLRRAFLDAGFDRIGLRGIWMGSTPYLPSERREDEITLWLKEHPEVTKYAVLDDGFIPGHPQLDSRPNHFTGGLQDEHVDVLIGLLQ